MSDCVTYIYFVYLTVLLFFSVFAAFDASKILINNHVFFTECRPRLSSLEDLILVSQATD